MGHDFSLTNHGEECPTCHRSDNIEINQTGLSYNHSWALYEFLGHGLTWIYNKPLVEIIPALEDVLECLEQLDYWQYNFSNTPENMFYTLRNAHGLVSAVTMDGWAPTVGNAHYFIKEIVDTSKKALEDGYTNATWYGD